VRFEPTRIQGAYLIDLEPRADERGFFARVWCEKEFAAHGLSTAFVQCNTSLCERRGTLRGLHYQTAPFEEAKLMRCVRGAIFDVLADVRPASATFGQWIGVELTADNRRMLYVPPGVAHGYQALEDRSEILYPVSEFYHPEVERGVRWNDPFFAIAWPIGDPILSPKDEAWRDFARATDDDVVVTTS